jgi:hypothetical protein
MAGARQAEQEAAGLLATPRVLAEGKRKGMSAPLLDKENAIQLVSISCTRFTSPCG